MLTIDHQAGLEALLLVRKGFIPKAICQYDAWLQPDVGHSYCFDGQQCMDMLTYSYSNVCLVKERSRSCDWGAAKWEAALAFIKMYLKAAVHPLLLSFFSVL